MAHIGREPQLFASVFLSCSLCVCISFVPSFLPLQVTNRQDFECTRMFTRQSGAEVSHSTCTPFSIRSDYRSSTSTVECGVLVKMYISPPNYLTSQRNYMQAGKQTDREANNKQKHSKLFTNETKCFAIINLII